MVLFRRKTGAILIGLAVAGMLGAGVASAVIPDAKGVIHGCYSVKTGALRVIDYPTSSCAKGELAVDWNVQGAPATRLWGRVAADGTLAAGSGIAAVKHSGTGAYEVVFAQDVSNCAYSATPAKAQMIGALSQAPDNPNDVLVVVSGDAINGTDMDFSVEAFC